MAYIVMANLRSYGLYSYGKRYYKVLQDCAKVGARVEHQERGKGTVCLIDPDYEVPKSDSN